MRNLLWAGAALAGAALVAPVQASSVTVGTVLTAADDGTASSALSDTNKDSSVGDGATAASPFTLATGNYTLASLTFWGNMLSGAVAPQSFTVSIFAPTSSGLVPEDMPLTEATFSLTGADTGYIDYYQVPILRYDWTPSTAFSVHSDGSLFLSIAGNSTDDDVFFWTFNDAGSFVQRGNTGARTWTEGDPEGALRFSATFNSVDVTGPVPEPATWGMMVLGFGIAGTAIRRRARQVAAVA